MLFGLGCLFGFGIGFFFFNKLGFCIVFVFFGLGFDVMVYEIFLL